MQLKSYTMDNPGLHGRVLIIDDQEPNRYIMRRILSHAEFQVDEACSGAEGLTKAMELPDLIIADVNLPDMLGYDVCRRLKLNPVTRNIPVLQISATFTSDESRVQALEGGADSFLIQPIEPPVLIATVKALLRLRKAEALSRISAMQWQTTFDSLSDGLVLADADGIVLRTNRRLIQMLEIAPSASEGMPLAQLFGSRFSVPWKDFREPQHADVSAELTYNNRWFRVRCDSIRADEDTISSYVLVLTDITDHKKLQETLKLSERLAATGRLAHIIAHEINNPLEAMSNLLNLAERGATKDSEVLSYIQQASFELLRISDITKQVLAYHRESKQPVSISASEILEGVLAMFRAHIGGMGIQLSTRIGCDSQIFVHPGEIRQVFGNLISNAVDAVPSSQGKLRVRCFQARDIRSNVQGVRFLFSDNGTGISPDVIPHIFGAFYTTKETKGSGIGLWIASEVIAKHCGTVRVRTRTEGPYRGTLFDIFVPFSPHALAENEEPA